MIPSAGAFSASGSIQKHSSHSRLGGGRRVGIRASCVRIQKTSVPIQALTDAKLLAWERKGHTVIRDLLPKAQLDTIQQEMQEVVQHRTLEALRHRVRVLCPGVDPDLVQTEQKARQLIKNKGSDPLGFLQYFNLHLDYPSVRRLVLGPELATVAAKLLGVTRVRLYQDCLFMKQPGYAETNWHSDLRMTPFDTNAYVTAWIPLRAIAAGAKDSGLQFASGSHRVRSDKDARSVFYVPLVQPQGINVVFFTDDCCSHLQDFALPFLHNMDGRSLDDRHYTITSTGAMEVGDVSFHHGWLLHCAAAQPKHTQPRLALSVSFFADGARLLARQGDETVHKHVMHTEDEESYARWIKDLPDGAKAVHEALPVVFPQTHPAV